jgi:hypothetical protein
MSWTRLHQVRVNAEAAVTELCDCLVRLVDERDEARRLAEEWREWAYDRLDGIDELKCPPDKMPWESEP